MDTADESEAISDKTGAIDEPSSVKDTVEEVSKSPAKSPTKGKKGKVSAMFIRIRIFRMVRILTNIVLEFCKFFEFEVWLAYHVSNEHFNELT